MIILWFRWWWRWWL